MGSTSGSAPGLLAPLAALACLLGLSAGQANVGLAVATSLIVGVVTYAAMSALFRRRRQKWRIGSRIDDAVLLASVKPAERDELERSAIRLSDRLDATQAELSILEHRALRAEEQVREALKLLEAVAASALPGVETIEREAHALIADSEGRVDRRGPAGRIAREAASLHTRLADITALAQIDGAEVRRDAVPSQLGTLLESAAENCEHVTTKVDPSVPDLLMVERITFGHALGDLFVHLERKGIERCTVEARAQPAAGDLVQVEILVDCARPLDTAELGLISGSESRHGLVPRDSGCGLSLALAGRALTRLGGRVESRGEGRVLAIELVLPLAIERRAPEKVAAAPETLLELVRNH